MGACWANMAQKQDLTPPPPPRFFACYGSRWGLAVVGGRVSGTGVGAEARGKEGGKGGEPGEVEGEGVGMNWQVERPASWQRTI